MDADESPRSRPSPLLLLGATLALGFAIAVLLNTNFSGRPYTLAQEARVKIVGHRNVVAWGGGDCRSCHRSP